jgi:hypothetical protein
LFPVTKVAVCDYFRKKASVFLNTKFKDNERSPCGSHSLRASGSTLARGNIQGSSEQRGAVDRYLDQFMGKRIPEQQRVYDSKDRNSWRETWRTCVEPYVTPKTF